MFFVDKIKWEIHPKRYKRARKKSKVKKKQQQQQNGKNGFKI